MKLHSTKTEKKSTGVYLEVAILEEIAKVATHNNMSTNEAITQLIKLGMEKAKEDK